MYVRDMIRVCEGACTRYPPSDTIPAVLISSRRPYIVLYAASLQLTGNAPRYLQQCRYQLRYIYTSAYSLSIEIP